MLPRPRGAQIFFRRPFTVNLQEYLAHKELLIDFGLNPQPTGITAHPVVVTQRIVTGWYTAKRLLRVLQLTVECHEAAFDVLETDVQKRARRS